MDDYIRREAAMRAMLDFADFYCDEIQGAEECVIEYMNAIPAADVRPVVRGKWIKSKKHTWVKNPDGTVNEFAWGSGYHNGPYCTICGESPCVHCKPNYDDGECEKEHYECPLCGRIEMKKEPFCNCGADMREAEHETTDR